VLICFFIQFLRPLQPPFNKTTNELSPRGHEKDRILKKLLAPLSMPITNGLLQLWSEWKNQGQTINTTDGTTEDLVDSNA
jgi:hypothetical protein